MKRSLTQTVVKSVCDTGDLMSDWWDHISFWEYFCVMLVAFAFAVHLLRKTN